MNVALEASWMAQFWEALKKELAAAFKVDFSKIGEEIRHGILQWKGSFTLGGQKFLITDAVIVTWIAMFVMIILAIWMSGKREKMPSARQALLESLIGLLFGLCKDYGLNEEQAEKVVPMVGTIGLFLIGCNVISIFEIPPPAKNIAFPVSMALFAILFVIFSAIRFVGIKGFARSFVDPKGFMVPFKIIDFFIKPISLALRLFGNVFGAFILMEFLHLVIPIIIPGAFSLWFDLADGVLQAIVFSYLTISYIGEIVESAHAVEERKEEQKAMKKKKAAEAEAEAKAA